MKSIVAVPILCLSMVVPSVSWSANFPEAGVDKTTSIGQFGIRLTQKWGKTILGINDCPTNPKCLFTSPFLIDYNTQIGRSDPHKDSNDANSTDKKGAFICDQPGPGVPACSNFATQTVKDSDLILPTFPVPLKFNEGPNGTREIHTQILTFNMNHWKNQLRCDAKFSANSVKAGSAAPNRDRSIGEIEAKTANGDFPAESFFNVFVEVDVDWNLDNTRNLIVYNKSPLVIQNANLNKLPPRVVYIHDGKENAPAVYDTVTGEPVGWITLAGHGVGYDCSQIDQFKEIMSNMKEVKKLEPIIPSAGVDKTRSLGRFGIRLTKDMGQKLLSINTCPFGDPKCFIRSPVLLDLNTRIGRSAPHKDADPTDTGGANVCKQGTNNSCSQFFAAKVKDSDFSFVPNNPFIEGPAGTREIHTQIVGFNMNHWSGQKNCDNKSSANAVRAGGTIPRSIGEVEVKNGVTGEFPAESFFDIFVEVDLDWNLDNTKDITLINKSPLVIQNGNLMKLPPNVIYNHGGSDNAPAVYNKDTGEPFGWVTLAGHGIGYDCTKVKEFVKVVDQMKEQTNLEPLIVLSVSLDTFTANAADGKITINWTTGTETNNAGFTLWRATPIDGQCTLNPSNYKDVKKVQPLVYSKSQDGVLGASYSEEDQNVEPNVTYCYGLEDVDYDGNGFFHADKIISARLN